MFTSLPILALEGCVFGSFEAGLGISSGRCQLDPLPQLLEF